MKFLVKPSAKLKVHEGCRGDCGSQCIGRCTNLGSCFCPLK